MKLTKKDIQIQVFEVTADYRKKKANKPLLAVLKLVEGHWQIDAQILQEELLKILPLQACHNLLERYKKQGYLTGDNEKGFSLSHIGQASVKEQAVLEPHQGTLRVYLSPKNIPWLKENHWVCKIEEVERRGANKKQTKKTPIEVKELHNHYVNLKGNTYYFEKIDSQCFQLDNKTLSITAEQKGTGVQFTLEDAIVDEENLNLRETVLQNHFGQNYQDHTVHIDFDNNTAFERTVKAERPRIEKVVFDSTSIPDVKYQPSSNMEAEKWREALLNERMATHSYFFEDKAFEAFEQDCIKPFQAHLQLTSKGRDYWIDTLERAGLFYASAKLSTPQILTL